MLQRKTANSGYDLGHFPAIGRLIADPSIAQMRTPGSPGLSEGGGFLRDIRGVQIATGHQWLLCQKTNGMLGLMWFLMSWTNARDFFLEKFSRWPCPKKKNWFWMVSSYKSGEGTSRFLRIALGNHDISPKSHGSLFPIELLFWGTGIAHFPTSPNITLQCFFYIYIHCIYA